MNKEASADLIMKLYDLRREEKMREARNWFIGFFPQSPEHILQTMIDPATSAGYRMVTSYWDMAAGFVNQGAVDEEMFLLSANEMWVVFSKVQPYLAQLRELTGIPTMMSQVETLVMRQPDAEAGLAARRETTKRWMEARASMATSAA